MMFSKRRAALRTRRIFFIAALALTAAISPRATAQQNIVLQNDATASKTAPAPNAEKSRLQRVAPSSSTASNSTASNATSPTTPRVLAPAISRADRDLIEAAFAGETWKAREALSRGAKIEARDPGSNWTPLMWASLNGRLGTVRYLLSRGAKGDALGGGDRRMILLNLGREYSPSSGGGATVARSGFFIGNANVTALLLASCGGYGMTVEELLKRGANPNIAAASGDAPLAGAAYSGNLASVEALLKNGAKLEARDFQGGTALVSAVLEGRTEVVKALLQRGASTRVTWRNLSLPDIAKARGFGNIARMLKTAARN
ncbi:MAG: ankyrin repeat domain-containing protein [Acidimicrobiales bacterium]